MIEELHEIDPNQKTKKLDIVTRTGSRWKIFVDGVLQVGEHDDENKAMARAFNLQVENPNSNITYTQEAIRAVIYK